MSQRIIFFGNDFRSVKENLRKLIDGGLGIYAYNSAYDHIKKESINIFLRISLEDLKWNGYFIEPSDEVIRKLEKLIRDFGFEPHKYEGPIHISRIKANMIIYSVPLYLNPPELPYFIDNNISESLGELGEGGVGLSYDPWEKDYNTLIRDIERILRHSKERILIAYYSNDELICKIVHDTAEERIIDSEAVPSKKDNKQDHDLPYIESQKKDPRNYDLTVICTPLVNGVIPREIKYWIERKTKHAHNEVFNKVLLILVHNGDDINGISEKLIDEFGSLCKKPIKKMFLSREEISKNVIIDLFPKQ